jgi:D-xylulose reductase
MTTSTTTQAMQNPSIVLYGARNAKLQDTDIPELVDAHDVLVRIAFVGVCGSDVCKYIGC